MWGVRGIGSAQNAMVIDVIAKKKIEPEDDPVSELSEIAGSSSNDRYHVNLYKRRAHICVTPAGECYHLQDCEALQKRAWCNI